MLIIPIKHLGWCPAHHKHPTDVTADINHPGFSWRILSGRHVNLHHKQVNIITVVFNCNVSLVSSDLLFPQSFLAFYDLDTLEECGPVILENAFNLGLSDIVP